jgi:DNA-binding transcriptional regulator YbjK
MDSSNSNGPKTPLKGTAAVPAATGQSAEAYARWLEHMQRARGRHAAITRNLYTWSNYKTWADKVKNSFEPGGTK